MVVKIDDFIMSILQGTKVHGLKDRNGKKMTDAYLQNELSKEYERLTHVYKKTSGSGHLSEPHFRNTIHAKKGGEQGYLKIYIDPDDIMVSDEAHAEATECMILATSEVLMSMRTWMESKPTVNRSIRSNL